MLEYVLAAGRFVLPVLALFLIVGCTRSLIRIRPRKAPLAMLKNLANGDKTVIDRWETSIGRHEKCDIVLSYDTVSRYHAVISHRENGWMVSDTYSKTGVYVNGEKINKNAPISDGDNIAFGNALFSFHTKEEEQEPEVIEQVESIEQAEKAVQPVKAVKTIKRIPKLTNKLTGDVYILHGGENRIGRDASCDIVLPVQSVSRNHASIGRVQGEWIVRDNGSRSGTLLNGEHISRAQILADGDIINIGGVELIFNG